MDLGNFLKDASVSDLDWLDVDEKEYRETEVLPKQNLDIQPDLEALWAREGESPTAYLIPNVVTVPTFGIDDPKTMGDMSQAHGKLSKAEEIRKVARLILIQSNNASKIKDGLIKRFGSDLLKEHHDVLAQVFQERGLLGSLYIDAADFSNCSQGAEFVHKYAKEALYVLAKSACEGCSCTNMVNGACHCGVFHKEIKVNIPYSDALADEVEKCCGKKCTASSPKERIRQAFLAPNALSSGVYSGQGISFVSKPISVTSQDTEKQVKQAVDSMRAKQAAMDAQPVIKFLHREMVKGLSRVELAQSIKLAFDKDLLEHTFSYWGPIAKEAGLYGVVYTKQESFDDCHAGADFLAKHNPNVRAVVAGLKCGSCVYNKVRCLLYGKKLVKDASEVINNETVQSALLEHRTAGRLASSDTDWDSDPSKALRAIHETTRKAFLPQVAPVRMGFMQGFHGQTVGETTSGLTRRNIVKQAARYLNEGLYGSDLLTALKTRFEIRDIIAAKKELRPILAEQGLQGIFYVDPSVYDDYGKGCEEASRLHRTRLVGYIKQGSKCASCVHQVNSGFCSKINKQLVDEPPYVDKVAQQREVLASGKATEVSYASLINNGTSMITEFQMQNPMNVEVREASVPDKTVIQFGTGKVRL